MRRDVPRAVGLALALVACKATPAPDDAPARRLEPPVLRAPLHGAHVGGAPTLRWEAAAPAGGGDVAYDVQLDDGCAKAPLAACAPAPDLAHTTSDTAWQPPRVPAGRWAWRVRACAGAVCSPWSRPRRVDVGRVPGDVDGDGFSDVLAGAPLYDARGRDQGAALVVFGGAGSGGKARTARLDEPGGHDDAEHGAALAIVGDVDGDGFDDVVVGAPGSDEGRGRAYLYRGGAQGLGGPALTLVDPGGRPGDWLGASVAAAGDVDGDGFADVAVAAPGADGDGPGEIDRGKVLVWRGSAVGLTGAPQVLSAGAPRPHDGFGSSLTAGDLDGDGRDDLVVGAAGIDRAGAVVGVDRGAVYVFAGGRDGLGSSPVARLEAPSPADHDRFGYALTAGGDLDGDGFADLVVGAPSRDHGTARIDSGALYVFGGAPGGVARAAREALVAGAGGAPYRRLGTALSIVGDVDGDGGDDLAVGTSGAAGGLAVVLSGKDPGGAPLAVLDADLPGTAAFGDSVAGAGDVDGDGRIDLVVGASGAPSQGGAAGGAILVFRAVGAARPPAPVRIDGPGEPAQLGRTVAGR